VADFFVAAVESPHQLVNVRAGCSKLFGSDGSMALHGGHEAIGDGAGNVAEFISSKADEGFGGSR